MDIDKIISDIDKITSKATYEEMNELKKVVASKTRERHREAKNKAVMNVGVLVMRHRKAALTELSNPDIGKAIEEASKYFTEPKTNKTEKVA